MELVAPMLTSARFSCVSLRSSHPAACSRLLSLELNSPPLHAEHVMGITALRFLTVAFGNKVILRDMSPLPWPEKTDNFRDSWQHSWPSEI